MKAFSVLSLGLLFLIAESYAAEDQAKQNMDWWKNMVVYHLYPRSFKDSDGDGIGDLNGIINELEYFKESGIDALMLSTIFSSPQKDFGYDISNFTDISPDYGTLEDVDKFLAKAKSLNIRVLFDFVPNHTSDQHEWFKKSIDRIKPYDDYYVWKDGKNGGPPNNWLSDFGGSAWKFNEKREQYYYHAFTAEQPDLNYRSRKLLEEMSNVLIFWMNRGVDGFRVDAVNCIFEDANFRDEPRSDVDVPPGNPLYLKRIYTRNLLENYGVVEHWQSIVDDYVKTYHTDAKPLIIETYANISSSIKYYEVATMPFNFMFMTNGKNNSLAVDFKDFINNWISSTPKNKVMNWVVGNHDRPRVASRYGYNNNRADQITMLAMVLPGIAVSYYGDEIGMVDRPFTSEESLKYVGIDFRGPARTPFQWNNLTSAGFSSNPETWLPVHENYKILNLAAQKEAKVSHYKVFQALTRLKKTPCLLKGNVEVSVAADNVLVVVRRLTGEKPIVLLINFDNDAIQVNISTSLNIDEKLKIYTASVYSGFLPEQEILTANLTLPGAASVILA